MELGLEFLTPDIQKKLMEDQVMSPKKTEGDDNIDDSDDKVNKNIIEHKEERDDASSKVENSSPYVLLGKHLIEEGLLSEELREELEEDPTIEGLTSALTKHLDAIANAKVSQYEPDVQEYISLVKQGVDKETAKTLMKEAVDLEKITDDVLENSESVQENIVRQYLGKLGMSSDEIDEQVEYFKDTDKLYSKSSGFKSKLEDLNKKEKAAQVEKVSVLRKQQEVENKQLLEKVKTQVDSYDEIIPGIKVPKGVKEKIYKNLTTPVALDDNGNPVTFVQSVRAKDPIKFEILLNYFADQGFFDGKFDTVLKGAKSKTIEQLEKTLSSSTIFDKGIATVTKTAGDNDATSSKEIAASIPGSMDELLKFYNNK